MVWFQLLPPPNTVTNDSSRPLEQPGTGGVRRPDRPWSVGAASSGVSMGAAIGDWAVIRRKHGHKKRSEKTKAR